MRHGEAARQQGGLAVAALAMACASACSDAVTAAPGPPCLSVAQRVVALEVGDAGGLNAETVPSPALGLPQGAGETRGSTDVVALGAGGTLTLELAPPVVDLPGSDLVIYENAFVLAGSTDRFEEWAELAVSAEGERFTPFPCDRRSGEGCAGRAPVQPGSPDAGALTALGGDSFDLAELGLSEVRFVRLTDVDGPQPNAWIAAPARGFDLDAVVGRACVPAR